MNAQNQLKRILAPESCYGRQALLAAFERALTYNTFSYRFLCGLLSQEELSKRPRQARGKSLL